MKKHTFITYMKSIIPELQTHKLYIPRGQYYYTVIIYKEAVREGNRTARDAGPVGRQ